MTNFEPKPEHKFTFGLWTVGNRGRYPFGDAVRDPMSPVEMIPTGGVSLETAADFIKAGASALGVGTDLVDIKAIRAGDSQIVTDRARQFLQIVRDARSGRSSEKE